MRYEGPLYRPPSEADSAILQATLGCSWNACTYCDMYRSKRYVERGVPEVLADVATLAQHLRGRVRKVFVADGDALGMPMDHWLPILDGLAEAFGPLKRVSCYAMARNVLEKSDAELEALAARGLTRLYIGPESGDDVTLKRIAKGSTHTEHVEAAQRAKAAGMEISVIALLGAGGVERSEVHARETARLVTGMDPEFFAALTLTVVPGTPIAKQVEKGRFTLPDPPQLLAELRTMVAESQPTDAIFRTNHASNYLPLRGRLPVDGPAMADAIDAALDGEIPLRPEWTRGL